MLVFVNYKSYKNNPKCRYNYLVVTGIVKRLSK